MTRRQWWVLILLLMLGLVLRGIAIDTRSIQYDDTFSIFLAERSLPEIVSGTAADTMPPLYYFLIHFWLQFSQSIAWLRLLSVLLSLGGAAALFWLVRQLAGVEAGLWAVLLAAISPLQIYHAQDLRMYALLAMMQLLYAGFFVRLWQGRGGRGSWLGLVLAGTAAMYTHNLAVFVLVVPDFVLLLRREWKLLGRLVLAQAVIGGLALPWLLLIPGQVEKIQRAFWTPQPGVVEVVQAVIMAVSNLPLPEGWLLVGAVVALEVSALMGIELVRQRKNLNKSAYLLAMALIPPALLFAASYIMRPVFVPRGFLAALMAFVGLAGVVIGSSWRRGAGGLILAGFVFGAAMVLPYQIGFREFPRSAFEQALQPLVGTIQSGEVIIHDNKLSYFPAKFYYPNLPQVFLADEPGSTNDTFAPGSQQAMQIFPVTSLQAAVGAHRRVYFVVFSRTIAEYGGNHPALEWLNQHVALETRQVVGDLEIYTYRC